MLKHAGGKLDLVLVDAPPVGLVIDAAEIAQNRDGAVFVGIWAKHAAKEIADSKEQIEQAGCPVLGCIINKMTFDSISAKKYYNKS